MSSPAPSTPVLSETLRGGAGWSWVLRRGQRLRLTDSDGGGNLALMAYHAAQPLERYNMPDTLKAQHTAHLGLHKVAMSDMGRCLLSFVEDDLGWHDTICGYSDAHTVAERYGSRSYQEARNQFYRSAKELLLIELGKHGLGKRDVTASMNLMSKVVPDAEGDLHFVPDHSPPGSTVTLRADMDVLVVMAAVQHPLDPCSDYQPRRFELRLENGKPAEGDDPCRLACAESGRAFTLTDRLYAA